MTAGIEKVSPSIKKREKTKKHDRIVLSIKSKLYSIEFLSR